MIQVQDLIKRIAFALDAEDSDRYLFEQDYKPAINSSIEWVVAVVNSALSERKLSEEALRELIKTKVWQTNSFSRLALDYNVLGDKIWSIVKVSPEPVVYPDLPVNVVADEYESQLRDDLSFIKSQYSAKRLTFEEWNENVDNIFEAGNEALSDQFKSYAYLNMSDYNSDNYTASSPEIEIRPEVPNSFVAITYLKYPDSIQTENDSVPFPETLIDLIFQKALNFISYKQGDRTNLFTVTNNDIATIVKLIV